MAAILRLPAQSAPMHALSPRQLVTLALLTLIWGLNWPIMKLGVTDFPPLTFRTLSMWLSLPVLWLVLRGMRVPLRVAREHWRELFWLAFANMFIWQGLIILAVKSLSSGRAAILGYTMPIFSAVLGALFFGNKMLPRAWAGVVAAGAGVVLLLWYEFTHLTGSPLGVMEALIAAAAWAVGTQMLRRTTLPVATLTLSFWMTALTTLVMTLLALLFEASQWKTPSGATWAAILFNAVLVFGLAQAAWFSLARGLPPVASTLSVMLIPILGVFSGAVWLHEALHWQDWTAVALMVAAIGSVLAPAHKA